MEEDLDDLLDSDEPTAHTALLKGWAPIAMFALLIATTALLGAGVVLSEVGLGRATAARGCDSGLAAGLVLLVVCGGVLGLARVFVDRRFVQEVVFDHTRFWYLLPLPAAALLLSAPGFLGCALAADIADLAVVGDALTGTPGIALAGASAFAFGFVPSTAVRLRTPVEQIIAHYEELRGEGARYDPVEAALRRVEEENLPVGDVDDFAQSERYDPVSNPPGAYPDPVSNFPRSVSGLDETPEGSEHDDDDN